MPLASLLSLALALAPRLHLQESAGQNPGLEPLLSAAGSAAPAQIVQLADGVLVADEDLWMAELGEHLAGAGPGQSLLLARLLANVDSAGGADALTALLAGGDDDFASAALSTLALPAFRLDENAQKRLGDWLAQPEAQSVPQRYAEACRVLYEIGDSARRRAARRYLEALLTSAESGARATAALTLARVGGDGTDLVDELERIARGTGSDAAMAQTLLEQREAEERWKAKFEELDRVLRSRSESLAGRASGPDDPRLLLEVRDLIRALHVESAQFEEEELIDAAANGMLQRLDPYSDFMSGKLLKEFLFDIHPEYGGIGAYVNTIDGVFTIVRPIYTGPAFRIGLRSDDKILEVDGWSTIGQSNDAIIKRLKGPPGTEVRILVTRRGWSEPRSYTITREQVRIPTLESEMLPGNVLYLELVQFDDAAGTQIRKAIEEARSRGPVNGVVLDLRNNNGGLLSQAVGVCEAFLPQNSLVVYTRNKAGKELRYFTNEPPSVPADLPLTVLINKFSASASEIVAGCLAAYRRADLVGERSHGKGSVQNMIPLQTLPDESYQDLNHDGMWEEGEPYKDQNGNGQFDFGPRVKLTVAYYYFADGSTIHTQRDRDGKVVDEGGVQPDVTVDWQPIDPFLVQEIEHYMDPADRFQEYAKKLYQETPDLAVALAEYDGRDVQRYPGWEAFYQGLETRLSPDEVRRWVRARLRVVVSDARGKNFPGSGNIFAGDFVEDPQLQQAIRTVLQQAGVTADQYPKEYELLAATPLATAGPGTSRG